MLQLLNSNVKIYNPFKNKFTNEYTVKSGKIEYTFPAITESDGQKILDVMILRGDDSDGVPNALSDDDSFFNPNKKQKAFGYKKITEVIEDKREHDRIKHENKKNIERNKMLIDLSMIPEDIQQAIREEYMKQIKNKS